MKAVDDGSYYFFRKLSLISVIGLALISVLLLPSYVVHATQTAAAPLSVTVTPSGGGGRSSNGGVVGGILLGIDSGGTNETPPLNQQINRYPDYTTQYTSSGPCYISGGGTGFCGGGAYLPATSGYPLIVTFSTIYEGAFGSYINYTGNTYYNCSPDGTGGVGDVAAWNAAASNDPSWANSVRNAINTDYVGYLSSIYAVRLNWEWAGSWFCQSPWKYEVAGHNGDQSSEQNYVISPATWAAGTNNTIAILRQLLPGVKICVDAPGNTYEQQWTDPVANNVDCFAFDAYYQSYWGSTAEAAWQYTGGDGAVPWCRNNPSATYNCIDLPFFASYAAGHGKPLVIGETCDSFNDGVIITKISNWSVANNVVAFGYWDNPDTPPSCSLSLNPSTGAAFKAFWGGVSYNQSYWTHKASPPSNPPGDAIGY